MTEYYTCRAVNESQRLRFFHPIPVVDVALYWGARGVACVWSGLAFRFCKCLTDWGRYQPRLAGLGAALKRADPLKWHFKAKATLKGRAICERWLPLMGNMACWHEFFSVLEHGLSLFIHLLQISYFLNYLFKNCCS